MLSLSHGDAGVVLLPKTFHCTFQPVYVLLLSCLRNVSLRIFFPGSPVRKGRCCSLFLEVGVWKHWEINVEELAKALEIVPLQVNSIQAQVPPAFLASRS